MLTSSMVRMTKGAAASIILLLIAEPAGGNQEWIERYVGYSDKTVSQALMFLIEQGIVTKAGNRGEYCYQLATAEKQPPLPVEELATENTEEEEINIKEEVEEQIESENFRLAVKKKKKIQINQHRDDLLLLTNPLESEKFRLNFAELQAQGIQDPALSELAGLAHVTPELIKGHCLPDVDLSLAIYRIRKNYAVKKPPGDPANERRKYIEGEFADFVQH